MKEKNNEFEKLLDAVHNNNEKYVIDLIKNIDKYDYFYSDIIGNDDNALELFNALLKQNNDMIFLSIFLFMGKELKCNEAFYSFDLLNIREFEYLFNKNETIVEIFKNSPKHYKSIIEYIKNEDFKKSIDKKLYFSNKVNLSFPLEIKYPKFKNSNDFNFILENNNYIDFDIISSLGKIKLNDFSNINTNLLSHFLTKNKKNIAEKIIEVMKDNLSNVNEGQTYSLLNLYNENDHIKDSDSIEKRNKYIENLNKHFKKIKQELKLEFSKIVWFLYKNNFINTDEASQISLNIKLNSILNKKIAKDYKFSEKNNKNAFQNLISILSNYFINNSNKAIDKNAKYNNFLIQSIENKNIEMLDSILFKFSNNINFNNQKILNELYFLYKTYDSNNYFEKIMTCFKNNQFDFNHSFVDSFLHFLKEKADDESNPPLSYIFNSKNFKDCKSLGITKIENFLSYFINHVFDDKAVKYCFSCFKESETFNNFFDGKMKSIFEKRLFKEKIDNKKTSEIKKKIL